MRAMPEKPSRNEEEYFAKRDAELLRQQRASVQQAAAEAERRSHHMKCPKCGYDLITGEWHGVQIDQCTHCHGLWFDAGEAESVLAHPEPTMIGRVFRAVLRGVSGAKASDA
jgi:ribosomal protein L37AE/L43A